MRSAKRLRSPGLWAGITIALLVAGYAAVLVLSQPHPEGRRVDFSQLPQLAREGRVAEATILDQDSYVQGRLRNPPETFNTPFLRSETTRGRLVELLEMNRVRFRIDQQTGKAVLPQLAVLLPSLILVVVLAYFIVSYRRSSGMFAVRSGARRASEDDVVLRFSDVAAQEAAVTELRELAEFLGDPQRFLRLGARIPKGVLLYGPPGCGKTLLARAVAGESGAAFYSISGSDFVELYVGVGAARVRELFREAREHAPSILFIDEIDALARRRRSGGGGESGGDEQSQALNQLLTEMDGFSRDEGTIVIAATNRPDDLDPALLRPGRFDRTIGVDRPGEDGRAEILALHGRGKPLAANVDLVEIARRAVGFTGADLESVMNEAALLAAREGHPQIGQAHLDAALTRILDAPERQRRLSMRDRTVGARSLGSERVTFADVAGVGEALAELTEIRDFLSDPTRFARLGARFPRGFLLAGPPGVGKTLLARATAGEANAAFLSVAATEFTEVYVGEGSGRVRDLFGQARAMAPAIIFIDEIDAIGARREVSLDGHREREQTLNQILVELDGFRQRDGVIVMAATNRPEILDPALVRAGRFDRQIVIDLPDREDRRAILQVHVGMKRLDPGADLDALAGMTHGFSGADLANVMNEAALLAARSGRDTVAMSDLEAAVERATLGIGRAHALGDDERRALAVHEAGHVVVAAALDGRLPHLVSIVPSGAGLGRVWLTDPDGGLIRTRSGMIDELAVLLAGRAAEDLVFGEASTSAADDLVEVGRIAFRMVRDLGMSDALGAIGYGADGGYSEETARTIDAEARAIVAEAERRSLGLLRSRRGALEQVAGALLDAETLRAEQLAAVLRSSQPASAR